MSVMFGDERVQEALRASPAALTLPCPSPATDTALTPTRSLSGAGIYSGTSSPPFISCVIYVPALHLLRLARKAHYVSLAVATSISSPGIRAPSSSASFIFQVSLRPGGSCPGVWRAPTGLVPERTIVRAPGTVGSDRPWAACLGPRSEATFGDLSGLQSPGLNLASDSTDDWTVTSTSGSQSLHLQDGDRAGQRDPDSHSQGPRHVTRASQTVFHKLVNIPEKGRGQFHCLGHSGLSGGSGGCMVSSRRCARVIPSKCGCDLVLGKKAADPKVSLWMLLQPK